MNAILVTDDVHLATRLSKALTSLGVTCSSHANSPFESVETLIPQAEADRLILLDAIHHPAQVSVLVQRLAEKCNAVLVVVGAEDNPDQVLNFVRSGAQDYVDIRRDLNMELDGLLKRIAAKCKLPSKRGRLITVTSCSGGCGASTLAASLAVVFARQGTSCGLIDLHLCGGDLAALLQLEPRYTLFELASKGDALDGAMFRKSLIQHKTGISLLASPDPFRDYRKIQSTTVSRIVTLALDEFPFVVVDLEDLFHQEQTTTLKESDEIVLLFRLDFASLVRVKKCIEQLTKLKVQDRFRLIAGRFGQPRQLTIRNAESAIGFPITACIPEDPSTSLTSVNLGVPIVAESPDSRLAKTIVEIADLLSGKKTRVEDKGRLFPQKAIQAATAMLGIATA